MSCISLKTVFKHLASLLLPGLVSTFVAATTWAGTLSIFDSPGCPHCRKVFASLRNPAVTNDLLVLDLGEPDNYRRFLREAEQRGETNAWPGHLPVLMAGTTILRGPDDVIAYLNGDHSVTSAAHRAASRTDTQGDSTGIANHLFWIGLVDGINPCAFALMIFVCIALRLAGRKGGDIFAAAAVFAGAVGMTYLLFGWGLLTGIRCVLVSPLLRAIVYSVSAAACCIGVALSVVAIFKGGAPAGVPERWRNWLQRGMNRRFRFGTGLLVIAAAGVVAAGVEAVCTGQVYLPALLALERERGASWGALGMLLLYNLGFILPLTGVALGAGLGLKTIQLQNWGATQVRWANAALACVFTLFAVLLFRWSRDEWNWQKMASARTASFAGELRSSEKPTGTAQTSSAAGDHPLLDESRSNALARFAAILPGQNSMPALCRTPDNDLFWRFGSAGIAIDFWQPVLAQYTEGLVVSNWPFASLTTSQGENKAFGNSGQYGEYVASLAWWFVWQREHGRPAFRRLPSGDLLDIVNQACGGCGEATGFRLVTSRFGFRCDVGSVPAITLAASALPAVITWTSGGIEHGAILTRPPVSNQVVMIRFPFRGAAVSVGQTLPPNARAWLVSETPVADIRPDPLHVAGAR